jgi:glycosyltransferase involved in cell wall biosynthesis
VSDLSFVPISVIVPVKNEEKKVVACLASVAWAGEVWLVDSGSTDRTLELAADQKVKVAQFEYCGKYPKKKNWALSNLPLAYDWVLLLDADERVTPELQQEIRSLFADGAGAPEFDGYYTNRKLIFLGRWIKHCGWYPSWNMRLFRHRKGRYEQLETEGIADTGDVEVHEHVILQGSVGYLKNDLLHEDYKSIYHFIERHNRYSNWEARVYCNLASQQQASNSLGSSLFGSPLERKRMLKRLWVHLPGRPLLRFLWMYVIKLGFLDGRPGFIFCLLMALHEAVISAKIYENSLLERGQA